MRKKYPWKFMGSLTGLLALLVILIAVNVMLGTFRFRKDLTEDKIYTLSEGTRNIINSLNSPVTLKFFFTSSALEIPMPLKHFGREVQDLLREYEVVGSGKIKIERYDPKPDSDAEEWAERYGVISQNLGMTGPRFYLGIVAVKGDTYDTIPFLNPQTESLLEYNISRMIARIANPKKKVVGIISSLPVLGAQPMSYPRPGQPKPKNQPPWVAFQELSQDYDVRELPSDLDKIDDAIDLLVIVHPKNLSEKVLYAIDQFVLAGGRLLAFLDPFCLIDAELSRENPIQGVKPSSNLGKLLNAWSLAYNPEKILADFSAVTPVLQGTNNEVDESPVFLSLRGQHFDPNDIITAHLKFLVLPLAGTFSEKESESITVTPLLLSSKQSQLIDSTIAQFGSAYIRREFQESHEQHSLAVRLYGSFETAFPEGKPESEAKEDEQNTPPEQSQELEAVNHLTKGIKPTTIILVADVDMLYDQFSVQQLSFFGQNAYQPINDNINFFIQAVEQLAGGTELARIRSRRRFNRPFDKVLALQQQAQKRWLSQERALQEKLESTRDRLAQLQAQKDESQRFILSPEQQREIQHFKEEELRTGHELKQVRKNLREGIEQLGTKLKCINILLMPLLVSIAGISFAFHRFSRPKKVMTKNLD